MLYLITGANGAGKTLNTLKWVRQRQLDEGRPVCHNGRFEPIEGGELSSWKTIDMKEWQAEPDGTIFLVDECHNDFPLRAASATPPDYVRMLAEHRRRGFDFYLITQHPQNIDSFIRRLIGPPGWHRHLKRSFGADMVTVLEWPAVNPNCEKSGSGKDAQVSLQAFPKEVYKWYKSASLHTGKKRIPAKVWLFVACLLAVPALGWFALAKLPGRGAADTAKVEASTSVKDAAQARDGGASSAVAQKLTTAEWLQTRKARLPDFPHTASAYDEVTRPTVAPYPAACVKMGDRCDCYTQQATVMQVTYDVCAQIVKRGFFVDWQQQAPQQQPAQVPQPRPAPAPAAAQPVINVHVPPAPVQQPQPGGEWLQGLAARNAQVRSEISR